MAKKNTETKEQKEEIALIETMQKQIIPAKDLFIKVTGATPEALEKIKNTYSNAKFKNVKDLKGYEFIVQGAKDLKKLRTTIATKRKNMTAPANAFQKEMIAAEKEILDVIQPIEDDLNSKRIDFEDKVKAEKNKIFQERTKKLDSHGYQLNGDFYVCSAINIEAANIADMSNDDFDFYLQKGLEEMERIAAEEKRKADEAKALKEEREAIAKEKEEMRLEREEMAKEREEMAAQKKALAATYDEVEQPKKEEKVPPGVETKKPETVVVEKGPAVGPSTNMKITEQKEKVIVEVPSMKQKPADATGSVEESQIEVGFNEMRKRLIELASDKSIGLSRNGLIKWAEDQTLV